MKNCLSSHSTCNCTGDQLQFLQEGNLAASSEVQQFEHVVQPDEEKLRLDRYLVRKHPDFTRSYITRLIQSRDIHVDGRVVKPGHRVRGGERISVRIPVSSSTELLPEPVAFSILFEDEDITIISKPPGLVVHPAAGHQGGTLVNGLLHHYQQLPQLEQGRPGIVHRLDKDTSGVMLVAKKEPALRKLAQAFRERSITKIYFAVLQRSPNEEQGRINAPIGRHPVHRKKMAIRQNGGRYAVSNYQIVERFSNGMCLARVHIETGRTHQIRVHMASLHAPIVGDTLYGHGTSRIVQEMPGRQLLHASSIEFVHPSHGHPIHCTAPLWPDMRNYISHLREGAG